MSQSDTKPYGQDFLLEKGGFIKCQIEITEYIIGREKQLGDDIKKLNDELNTPAGLLKKQEIAIKLARLSGERDALRSLCHYTSSLQLSPLKLT